MENSDKLIIDACFNYIKPILDALDGVAAGGLCLVATKLAYTKLFSDLGGDIKVVGGKAAFSVNAGDYGFIDFGYNEDALSRLGGNLIGHFWFEYKGFIIDYSLPYLESLFKKDNARRGIADDSFLLPKDYIILKSKTKSYDTLFSGEIGHHYNEVAGMAIQLINMPFPSKDEFHKMILTGQYK